MLGIPRSADAEAIRTAYRAQAKQLHPDLSEGPSNEVFRRLQEAYDVLRDPERRAHYDDTLARPAARRPIRPTIKTKTTASPPGSGRGRRGARTSWGWAASWRPSGWW